MNPDTSTQTFSISSPAFENNGKIPVKYCEKSVQGGENISIPLSWQGIPEDIQSLFLIIVDTHPVAKNWIHWIIKNIPADATEIPEGASGTNSIPPKSIELTGTEGIKGYRGPAPPPGTGDHPYEIHLFALNSPGDNIEIPATLDWGTIQATLEPYIIQRTKYTGYYGR